MSKYTKRFVVEETIYQNEGENSKERFIDYYYDNEQTKENIRRTFYLTNFYMESKLKKDVYEFTVDEIDELLHSFQATTNSSLAVRVSHLKKYVDFCIRQSIKSNPINFFDDIEVDKYVMKNSYRYKYITRDDLYSVITNSMDNSQIAVMFILAFEGVLGKLKCELCNLKVNDIDFDNKTITVRAYDVINEKTQEVMHFPERIIDVEDNRTFDIIRKAITQTIYITPPSPGNEKENDDRLEFYDLADSEYVLRYVLSRNTANKERNNIPVTHSTVENRKFLANGYFKASPELTRRLSFTTLQQSGMIDKLISIKNKNGTVTVDDFKALMRQYNKKEFSYSNLKKIWESIEKERDL